MHTQLSHPFSSIILKCSEQFAGQATFSQCTDLSIHLQTVQPTSLTTVCIPEVHGGHFTGPHTVFASSLQAHTLQPSACVSVKVSLVQFVGHEKSGQPLHVHCVQPFADAV